jgi:Hypervirulence associated proteins TUDOR domain
MNRSLEPFAPGDRVKWKWGAHWAEGVVRETFTTRVERVIKGARIVRNGEADNPAYLIEQDNDAQVLKKHSELFRA